MRLALLIAVACTWSLPVAADEPARAVITDVFGNPPPTEYRSAQTLFFSAAGSEHGDLADSITWTVLPATLKIVPLWDRTRGPMVAIETGKEPPPSIVVVLSVAKDNQSAAVALPLLLDGQFPRPGPKPEPKPEPKPDPDPTPVPARALDLRIVENIQQRPVELVALLTNQTYLKQLETRGHKFRVHDRTSPEKLPGGIAVRDAVKVTDTLPLVLVFDAAGQPLGAFALPASTAALDSALKPFSSR